MTCELPYSDSVSMTIILPNKGISIKDLERNLTATHLTNILSSFTSFKSYIYLPKFNIKFQSDVSKSYNQ
jgi:serine protease inhibitor